MAEEGDAAEDGIPDPADLLEAAGFDADESVLTRRQAEVLALRERGFAQADIADLLGTSRANVSSVEASARGNVARARETVAFAEALAAPVRVRLEPGADLFDVPGQVFDACDEAGVKVGASTAELLRQVREAAPDAVEDETVAAPLLVSVAADGTVRVRRSEG